MITFLIDEHLVVKENGTIDVIKNMVISGMEGVDIFTVNISEGETETKFENYVSQTRSYTDASSIIDIIDDLSD